MNVYFVLGNVSLKADGLPGYLCLTEDSANHCLTWIPLSSLEPTQLDIFVQLCQQTRDYAFYLKTPIAPTHIQLPNGYLFTPLVDIVSLLLEPQLTLFCGEEACLTRLIVNLDGGSWPDLWFEPSPEDSVASFPSAQSILDLLRQWLRTVGWDLMGVDHVFSLTRSVLPDPLDDLRPASRWPSNIPKPSEDSVLFKLGTFGLGVLSNVVGKSQATKVEDVGWNALENFSKVTTFAKKTSHQILEHELAQPFVNSLPPKIRQSLQKSVVAETLLDEYDSAGEYLNRYGHEMRYSETRPTSTKDHSRDFDAIRGNLVSHMTDKPISEEWFDKKDPLLIQAQIFCRGVDEDIRMDVWRYILKFYPWEATEEQKSQIDQSKSAEYEQLKESWVKVMLEHGSPISIDNPCDESDSMDYVSKLQERKHRIDKDTIRTDPTISYFSFTDRPASSPSDIKLFIDCHPHLLELRNVLMTSAVYKFDIGYVQGMSDLCAPIMATVKDEVQTFWCFTAFLKSLESNFYKDQSGMKRQLTQLELLVKLIDPPLYQHLDTDSNNMFCCFRWILIHFKREFVYYDILHLWEVLWTCPFSDQFHLFVALAILNKYRQGIFEKKAFDEVLKFMNELSEQMDLLDILQRAEVLYFVFCDLLHADTHKLHELLEAASGIKRSVESPMRVPSEVIDLGITVNLTPEELQLLQPLLPRQEVQSPFLISLE